MKAPEEMAKEFAKEFYGDGEHIDFPDSQTFYVAGYRAAKAIVEEELQAVQAQRAEYPGLGAAQYALKSVLAKMGSK